MLDLDALLAEEEWTPVEIGQARLALLGDSGKPDDGKEPLGRKLTDDVIRDRIGRLSREDFAEYAVWATCGAWLQNFWLQASIRRELFETNIEKLVSNVELSDVAELAVCHIAGEGGAESGELWETAWPLVSGEMPGGGDAASSYKDRREAAAKAIRYVGGFNAAVGLIAEETGVEELSGLTLDTETAAQWIDVYNTDAATVRGRVLRHPYDRKRKDAVLQSLGKMFPPISKRGMFPPEENVEKARLLVSGLNAWREERAGELLNLLCVRNAPRRKKGNA